MQNQAQLPLLTIDQAAAKYPFSAKTIRNWIFRAEHFNFSGVILRIGRRVYLHEGKLVEWITSQNPNFISA